MIIFSTLLTNNSVFRDIHQFLKHQIDQPFHKRYLKRDDIAAEIVNCNTDLQDCLDHFGVRLHLTPISSIAYIVFSAINQLACSSVCQTDNYTEDTQP